MEDPVPGGPVPHDPAPGDPPQPAARHHAARPAWRRETEGEHRWPAAIAILLAVSLQLGLPSDLAPNPWWLLTAVEVALFVAVVAMNPTRINRESTVLRWLGLTLTVVVSLVTGWSACLLVHRLVAVHGPLVPTHLLLSDGSVWVTNVIVFALWYWETDRGGPAARASARREHPDFLFSQMSMPEFAAHDWEPTFVDYLFLSFTNATAFSPTDTAPLARWAKLAMMVQATVSLVTVGLIVARAVNILG